MSINKKLYEKVMEGPNREEAIREKMLMMFVRNMKKHMI